MKGLTPLIAALLLLAKLVCASPSLRTLKTSVPMVTRKSRRGGRSSGSSEYPFLAKAFPEALGSGTRMIGTIDKDKSETCAIVRELLKFCQDQDKPLMVEHKNGRKSELVPLPLTKKNGEKECDTKPNFKLFLDNTLKSKNMTDESMGNLMDACLDVFTKPANEELFKDKLRDRGISTHSVLNEFESAATVDEAGLKIWQWRVVQECISLYANVERIAVPDYRMRAIAGEDSPIVHDVYKYKDPENPDKVTEDIRYWTKDVVFEVLKSVGNIMNGYGLDTTMIEFINVCFGGDHGKEKFRFAAKIVLKTKDGAYYDDVFGLADVACKKDSADVLDNTCMPAMINGMNAVEDGTFVFTHEKESNTFSIDLVEDSKIEESVEKDKLLVKKPTAYLSGDLLFLAYMMGKPNFASSWCNWCDLPKTEWQSGQCIPVDEDRLWDFDRMQKQVEDNIKMGEGYGPKGTKTDPKMKGVRRVPECKIPFTRVIFAVLHAAIGIGNNLVHYLEQFIDAEVEDIGHEEKQLRNQLKTITSEHARLVETKRVWMKSQEGGRKIDWYRYRMKKWPTLISDPSIPAERKTVLETELVDFVAREKALVEVRENKSKQISVKQSALTKTKNKLDEKKKSRLTSESSVYTEVDRIFQNHGANRAHYFGRKFEGVDIRKIMNQVRAGRLCTRAYRPKLFFA